MIQFSMKRFAKLVRWSLPNDRIYYVRSFLQVFVALTLVFVGFATDVFKVTTSGVSRNYDTCCIAIAILFIGTAITGPSTMFYSMRGKHDRLALLMLPASNFEKYLMRYLSSWVLLLPLYLVAFFAADLIQFVVALLVGNHYPTFVTSYLINLVASSAPMPRNLLCALIMMGVWIHSFYALGGTFFRSRKFAWVLTSAAFIALAILYAWFFPFGHIDENTSTLEMTAWGAVYLFCVLVNFWLSYRLFCRQQVIGRFVNV